MAVDWKISKKYFYVVMISLLFIFGCLVGVILGSDVGRMMGSISIDEKPT